VWRTSTLRLVNTPRCRMEKFYLSRVVHIPRKASRARATVRQVRRIQPVNIFMQVDHRLRRDSMLDGIGAIRSVDRPRIIGLILVDRTLDRLRPWTDTLARHLRSYPMDDSVIIVHQVSHRDLPRPRRLLSPFLLRRYHDQARSCR
jgi:hypothetical protein